MNTKSKKPKTNLIFSYFCLNKKPSDNSVHFIAKYRGRYIGGKVVKMEHTEGYNIGSNFKIYKNDWPKLYELLGLYSESLYCDGQIDSGPKKIPREILDSNFEEYIKMIKDKEEGEINFFLNLFGGE